MTNFATQFNIDQVVGEERLAMGVAGVFGVPRSQVAVANFDDISSVPDGWFPPEKAVAIQVETMRGEFPLEVTVISRGQRDFESLVPRLAVALGVTVVTDEFGVEPWSDIQWLMITPDGVATRVLADDEEFGAEDPAIILQPAYRLIHQAHLNTAAD
jgi:hypothetical protein